MTEFEFRVSISFLSENFKVPDTSYITSKIKENDLIFYLITSRFHFNTNGTIFSIQNMLWKIIENCEENNINIIKLSIKTNSKLLERPVINEKMKVIAKYLLYIYIFGWIMTLR